MIGKKLTLDDFDRKIEECVSKVKTEGRLLQDKEPDSMTRKELRQVIRFLKASNELMEWRLRKVDTQIKRGLI